MIVELTVNGSDWRVDIEPRVLLVEELRNSLGLTGTKVGCDTSSCGACTVLLDGDPVKSCAMLAAQAAGRSITTIEGLTRSGELSPVQEAFRMEHAVQCGFCTPGLVVAVTALLERHPAPSSAQIEEGLSGNLCRCTGYVNIKRAVAAAIELRRGVTPEALAGRSHEHPIAESTGGHIARSEDIDDIEIV